MKKITLFALDIYKGPISVFLTQVLGLTVTCRFSPTCSDYMREMINTHGALLGVKKGINQLKKCHPLGGSYGTNI